MATTISQYFNHQNTPAIFLRFPRLLHLYFWLNHFSVLRMKYARRAIRHLFMSVEPPQRIVDAGCGMGDFLFSTPEFDQAKQLTGIDASTSNIDLCRKLMQLTQRENMKFICGDLATADFPPGQDLILCIGVLMYIADDIALLKKFNRSLAPNGRLLLYAAVNYRRSLSLYRRLAKNQEFDYDQIIGRPHTYTDQSLEQRLLDCGFSIEKKWHSFGTAAAVMFEISSIFEWVFKMWNPVFSVFFLPLYLIFYPVYLITMMFDFYGTRTTGNGVMIIAKINGEMSL